MQTGDLRPPQRLYGGAVVALSTIGLLAAFTLMWDKIKVLQNPEYVPSCNFNPVLACGNVISTDQASAFGFPNPILGLIGYSVMITIGVLLAADIPLPSWVLAGASVGSGLGVVFVHWLAWQSLYNIGSLCPWCMAVWAVTIPLFVLTLAAYRRQVLWGKFSQTFDGESYEGLSNGVLWRNQFLIIALWVGVFIAAIGQRFWDFWSSGLF